MNMTLKIIIVAALLLVQPFVFAQKVEDIITEAEVSRTIHLLAGDEMKGRGNGRAELLQAGLFIGDEFHQSGLKLFPGNASFFMPFRPFGGSKKGGSRSSRPDLPSMRTA